MSGNDLSQALVLYLGFGRAAYPVADKDAVAAAFGPDRAGALVEAVVSILAVLGALPIDWTQHDLSSGGRWAREEMRGRYPQLTEQALSALAWKFTFDWR